ncbi:hypothetical protein [Maribellus mangrovi]|uniref:hypothetical protein n=1 Tax=Maribellus mangrovi TaxID=3133146 RepID=UPI0030EF273D
MTELDKTKIGIGEMKGFAFTQKEASEKAYVYEVDMGEDVIYYEVFKRRINTRFEGQKVSYPTSKGFGIWAWSYRSYDRAVKKYNELNKGGNKWH